jgi:hypothetical protein
MELTIARGDRVRQVTSMTLVVTEVDDLITALTQMRERMISLPSPKPTAA